MVVVIDRRLCSAGRIEVRLPADESNRSGEDEVLLAYDYPVLGLFWTMFLLFLWVMWFFLLFRIVGDVFRSQDLGGWAKALWILFVLVLPFLGVLIYLIVRGHAMNQRDAEDMRRGEEAFQSYVRGVAGSTSSADELAKLADLKERGVITEAEFEQQKAKLLG
jgi:hypothetical protein